MKQCFPTFTELDGVKKLNPKKASQAADIQVKIIKENKDVVSLYVFHNFNNALSSCSFPTALRYADVQPAFKKDDETDKENDEPISILLSLSKVYERLMYDQMYHFLSQIFSKMQCGFRKGFRVEQCLIHIIEKWRKYLDTGGHGSALLTDLYKAFDCIDHQLLIAKLNAYGVYTNSRYILASYLVKTKQRTKVNGSYSNFDGTFSGVPQGSKLDRLLFNIYICDLIFGIGDLNIASYAGDITPYTFSSELDLALKKLKSYTIKIFEWFHENRLESNAGKCNLIIWRYNITSSTSPV